MCICWTKCINSHLVQWKQLQVSSTVCFIENKPLTQILKDHCDHKDSILSIMQPNLIPLNFCVSELGYYHITFSTMFKTISYKIEYVDKVDMQTYYSSQLVYTRITFNALINVHVFSQKLNSSNFRQRILQERKIS